MKVKAFICNMLHENCYVVYDEASREAAVIDPGFYWDDEKMLFVNYVRDNGLQVKYLLCTHLHRLRLDDYIYLCSGNLCREV